MEIVVTGLWPVGQLLARSLGSRRIARRSSCAVAAALWAA